MKTSNTKHYSRNTRLNDIDFCTAVGMGIGIGFGIYIGFKMASILPVLICVGVIMLAISICHPPERENFPKKYS